MFGSPEFQLAIECCRRSFRNAEPRPVANKIDWPRFLDLVRFHRIEGLAHQALQNDRSTPGDIADSLADASRSIAAANLRAAVACRSLQETFAAQAVPLLFVKGLTLGTLAYGNPALKSAVDIDILIDTDDLNSAAACLRSRGFRLVAPSRSLGRWHRSWKESVWRGDFDLQIDLHTRLADNPRLLSGITVHGTSQQVEVGSGITLPTLADGELFAYLAVHGASAGWFRLKWISDFAAFLSGRSPSDVLNWHDRSQSLGAGRAAGQALLIADTLFHTLQDLPELSQRLRNDRALSHLSRVALSLLGRNPEEPTERLFGTLPIHLSQLSLQSGAGFKLSQIRQQARQLLTRVTI